MPKRSDVLAAIGVAYLDAHRPSEFVASTIGGSVARGEADEYSDLDLNIYVEDTQDHVSQNRSFRGEFLQLHRHPFPTLRDVRDSAWGFRFLREARVLSDPTGRYEAFAQVAISWLESGAGLQSAKSGALADVGKRRRWAEQALSRGNYLEAGLGSMAAVTDAAMLYRYCAFGLVSTGAPLTRLCQTGEVPDLQPPWSHLDLRDAEDLVSGLSAYRRHLARHHGGGEDFVLDEVQNTLTSRKAARLVRRGDPLQLGETLYHETFWPLITRASRPLAHHLAALPAEIRSFFRRQGFDEANSTTVMHRLAWADEVCTMVEGE